MGRLAQKGLDYFSIDTTWETAVKLVKAKYGTLEGVGFLTELWASIYRENYYRKWDDEVELLFADEIKRPVEWVHEVVEYCFSKNIFDKAVYDAHGVLTSHGIQKRYFKIARDSLKRTGIDYIDGITYPEFMSENNLGGKADFPGGNRDNLGGKADKLGGYDHKARQGNRIKENIKHAGISSRDDAPIPEVASHSMPPAACPFITVQEIKSACSAAPFQIRLSARDLEDIAARLSAECLDARFVAYVVKRAQDPSVKSPGAFARSALLGGGAFAAMPDEYRADQAPAKSAEPQRDPPPERCDECKAEVRHSAFANDAFCSNPECGAFWTWDNAFGWLKSEERAVALQAAKWPEGVEGMERGA